MEKRYLQHISAIQLFRIGLLICFLTIGFQSFSQDRLFLRKGISVKCKIIAISENTISYRDTVAYSPIITMPKSEVILAEYKTGEVYIFNSAGLTSQSDDIVESHEQRKERKMKEWKAKEEKFSDNILGFYLPELILGRLTVSYEKLISNKSIGITIPVSLTYDSFGTLAVASANSNSSTTGTTVAAPITRNRGVNFIAGIDVNYYHDLKPELKYFFGPRIRYGTDMVLSGIEGLTFQVQNGIFKSRGQKSISSIAIGFGFVKLSEKSNAGRDPKQVYPWASFTWRLGFRL